MLQIDSFLLWLYWNPERVAFTIPLIDRQVAWYGLCFVFGFIIGYILLIPMFKRHLNAQKSVANLLVDRMTWFVVTGTIVGARLGHVFFYEWPHYQNDYAEIFRVWKGGLASHGGAVGILIALFFYQRYIRKQFPQFSFLVLLDMLVVPTAFAGFCIRIGNFINQEILGTETTVPWAIIFGDPADRSAIVPRHPVQLYEALAYLLSFGILFLLWKKYKTDRYVGLQSGLFFILIFGARFVLEFLKLPQSIMIDENLLQTGQILSIPFILAGILLCWHSKTSNKNIKYLDL